MLLGSPVHASSIRFSSSWHAIGAHHCVKRLYIFFNYLGSVLTILRLPYGKIANHAHKRCGYRSNECGRASAARRPFLTRQIVQKEFNGIVFDHCCSLRHTFSQRVDLFGVQDLIRAFEELPYTGPVHFQLQPADPERTKNKLVLSSMALIG